MLGAGGAGASGTCCRKWTGEGRKHDTQPFGESIHSVQPRLQAADSFHPPPIHARWLVRNLPCDADVRSFPTGYMSALDLALLYADMGMCLPAAPWNAVLAEIAEQGLQKKASLCRRRRLQIFTN